MAITYSGNPANVTANKLSVNAIQDGDAVNATGITPTTVERIADLLELISEQTAIQAVLTTFAFTTTTTPNDMCSSGLAVGGNVNDIVYVGAAGAIYTSLTLAGAWTSRTSNQTEALRGVASSGSLLVAVGGATGGKASSSPDGITWTAHNPGGANNLRAVVWGSGPALWCAVGDSGAAFTSPDGTTWTSRSGLGAAQLNAVVYGNGLFIAWQGGSTVTAYYTSPDGITWTARTFPDAAGISGNKGFMTWVPSISLWVAAGYLNGKIWTSPDGITWTNQINDATVSGLFVAYTGRIIVAFSALDYFLTSFDGINWKKRNSPTPTNPMGGNSVFTASNGSLVFVSFSGSSHAISMPLPTP